MATDIVQPIRIKVDIKKGLIQKPQNTILMMGDKNANRIIAELYDGNMPVTLDGVQVTGRFIRPPDGAEVLLSGEANGNEASVTLIDQCYATEGQYEANVILTSGNTRRTILTVTGDVHRSGSGAYVDVSGVIPSVDDILAQYATMQQVTAAAQTQADRAAAAAQRAEYLQIDASGMAGDSNRLGGNPPEYYENKVTAVNGETGDVSVSYLNGDKSRVSLRNEEGYSGIDFYGRIRGETELTMSGTIRQNLKEVNSRGFARLEYLNAANSRIGYIYSTEYPPTAAEVGIQIVTPQMYGALGNNLTDDTAAIQAAIDAVQNSGGGMVYFPQGVYVISDAIRVTDDGVRLVGECMQSTYIKQIVASKNCVEFIATAENTALSGVSISQLSLYHADPNKAEGEIGEISSGIGLKMEGCVNSSIENIIVSDFLVGVDLSGGGNMFVKAVGVATHVPDAIGFRHGGGCVSTQYVGIYAGFFAYTEDASAASAFDTGIGFSATSGNVADFTINYLDVGNGYYGVQINGANSPTATPPADIRLYEIVTDNCHGRGIYISKIGQRGNVLVQGGWHNDAWESGVLAIELSNAHNVRIQDVTFQQLLDADPTLYGIVASDCKNIIVSNNHFINIYAAMSFYNVDGAVVEGNVISLYDGYTSSSYAVNLGNAVRANVIGNIIRGTYVRAISLDATGSKCSITLNSIDGSTTPVSVAGTECYAENNIS